MKKPTQSKLKKSVTKVDKNIVDKFRDIGDGLGLGIDEGVLVSVAYLNELGYHTVSSCEGHTENHGVPFAWFHFTSDLGFKVSENLKSITNIVENEIRDKVNKLEEKIGSEEFKQKYTSFQEKFFVEIKKHPKYGDYKKEQDKLYALQEKLGEKIESLISEFCESEKVKMSYFYMHKVSELVRLEFCTKEESHKIDDEFDVGVDKIKNRAKYKKKSDLLIEKFEKFLIEKYNKINY